MGGEEGIEPIVPPRVPAVDADHRAGVQKRQGGVDVLRVADGVDDAVDAVRERLAQARGQVVCVIVDIRARPAAKKERLARRRSQRADLRARVRTVTYKGERVGPGTGDEHAHALLDANALHIAERLPPGDDHRRDALGDVRRHDLVDAGFFVQRLVQAVARHGLPVARHAVLRKAAPYRGNLLRFRRAHAGDEVAHGKGSHPFAHGEDAPHAFMPEDAGVAQRPRMASAS